MRPMKLEVTMPDIGKPIDYRPGIRSVLTLQFQLSAPGKGAAGGRRHDPDAESSLVVAGVYEAAQALAMKPAREKALQELQASAEFAAFETLRTELEQSSRAAEVARARVAELEARRVQLVKGDARGMAPKLRQLDEDLAQARTTSEDVEANARALRPVLQERREDAEAVLRECVSQAVASTRAEVMARRERLKGQLVERVRDLLQELLIAEVASRRCGQENLDQQIAKGLIEQLCRQADSGKAGAQEVQPVQANA